MKFIIVRFEESKKDEVTKSFPGKVLKAGDGVLIAKLGTSNVPLKEGVFIIQQEGKEEIYLCAKECITQLLEIISRNQDE